MFGYAPFSAVPFSTLQEKQFVEVFVENLGALDALTNSAALLNSLTENCGSADAYTTRQDIFNSIVESMSLTDNTSIISLHNFAIVENMRAEDTSFQAGWITVNNTQASNWVDINNSQ